MRKTKDDRGITIVALVITIIIMIILAAVMIPQLVDDKGIRQKALEAVDEHKKAENDEKSILNQIGMDDMGSVGSIGIGEMPTISAYIPDGFKYIEGSENTGIVIRDIIYGNEFVWVPVEENTITNSYVYGTIGPEPTEGVWNETYGAENEVLYANIQNFVNSVNTYGGFYIGRYEASKATVNGNANVVASKKGVMPWVNINSTNSRMYAYNMKTEYGWDVQTSLMSGYAFDATLKWIEKRKSGAGLLKNWGNLSNPESPADVEGYGTKQVTGYSEFWKTNNIYDLSGNVFEWTTEWRSNTSTQRTSRGSFSGSSGVPAIRSNGDGTYTGSSTSIGFRVVMYK